ncbi:MAG: cytochrome b [Asticcacaulis sp.]
MKFTDTRQTYGVFTRLLHWGMAFLIIWQFSGMISKVTLGRDHALTEALSGNHSQIGTILFLLILIRLVWALINRQHRPSQGEGLLSYAARLGHLGLYVLMLAVPSAALIRAWGNERAFSPFGFEIFAARTPETVNKTATDIGSNFHGELGWVLLALVCGHIFMALFHHFVLKDGTLKRMA